jgi:hypothetical protein
MAERSAFSRFLVLAVCLGATAVGLNNVYGSNEEVIRDAKRAACDGAECTADVLQQSRSAISQSFSLQVTATTNGKSRTATADVECRRDYLLVGAYKCALLSGGLPKAPTN